ncbi:MULTISPECIES: NAD-dependent succinate-semialdehyde dehydrogenase [unclassified Thioalkalivibrio]|uniref:NAD-dependent succinate-semialdehyde dehydrogenase n=1 Tax=unclassified Thioalkalivibrio TaxID=2621013 RepID=UPI00035C768A|nr:MULTISPECIES: NAD-dependent succinate-semialdehyde dehydrogenase [unclassified Thioalkalivibrio]
MTDLTAINPATGETLARYPRMGPEALEAALARAASAQQDWAAHPASVRAQCLRDLAAVLRDQREALARTATQEMGKRLVEARAEVDKCANGCEYYADRGPDFLQDTMIASDASRSFIAWQPLGTVLLVMPWNFPYWQAFRQALPATLAGNTVLLKHASNVPGCAEHLERVFTEAGLPEGVFQNLPVGSDAVEGIIADARVQGVSLTGSERAGRAVGAAAGKALKTSVLELGGSDAFIVLADADLDHTVEQAVRGRFQNNGETCIAAKRFIVEESIADAFVERFRTAIEALVIGDPMSDDTNIGPLARDDLRDELHDQVRRSVAAGARLVTGGEPLERAGYFYPPTLLDAVEPGMPAFDEETFGPVAAVTRARNADHAITLANRSRFGLGGSVWTADPVRGEALARRLECGCAFVNGIVKSDPRLPFGGVKDSGYGRELSELGIREFQNAKTIWVG